MSENWVSSVDMLADAGIINFDAAAYVTGTPARFVGRPNTPVYNLPPLSQQPQQDSFQSNNKDNSIVKNPLWKKVLFGILAIGGITWGCYKLSKMSKSINNWFSSITKFFKKS